MELAHQQQIIFFRLWSDILRELLPSSLLEEFSGKENEYLWIKEALTEIELIVDSIEQDREKQKKMMINRKSIIQESQKVISLKIK